MLLGTPNAFLGTGSGEEARKGDKWCYSGASWKHGWK
jgi:hypothetical protein